MNAVTKYKLSDSIIEKLYCRAFADSGEIKISAMSGGFCSSVYLIDSGKNRSCLRSGQRATLK